MSRTQRVIRDQSYGPDPMMRLDVYYLPEADDTAKFPVVVFWHGGSWKGGSKDRYAFMGKALAAMGCVGVIVNYRKYPAVRFPAFLDDGALAVKWVVEHIGEYGGDPTKLFLMGHSAGAHTAAFLAYQRHYLQKLDVSADRLAGFIGISGPYDFFPRPDLRPIFPVDDASRPWCLLDIDAGPPALLLHGRLDYTVYARKSRELAERLERQHIDAEVHILPTYDHFAIIAVYSWPLRTTTRPWRLTRQFIRSRLQ